MDTREKIIDWPRAAALKDAVFVVGYFDPLLAAQAARLATLTGPVVAVVMDPPDPILPTDARVVLAAGLSSVKHAVVATSDQLLELPLDRIMDERANHLLDREALGNHVRQRHQETT